MKRFALTTAAISALMAAPAMADLNTADAQTFKEMKEAYPALDRKVFEQVDVNKDGVADMAEIDAAEQSGVLHEEMSAAEATGTYDPSPNGVDEAGALTFSELKEEYPSLTKKVFEQVDVNKDGVADMAEIDEAELSDILEPGVGSTTEDKSYNQG